MALGSNSFRVNMSAFLNNCTSETVFVSTSFGDFSLQPSQQLQVQVGDYVLSAYSENLYFSYAFEIFDGMQASFTQSGNTMILGFPPDPVPDFVPNYLDGFGIGILFAGAILTIRILRMLRT